MSAFNVRTPADILAEAMSHNPVKCFVGFSGGDDSLATAAYCMENIPGCEVFHANTGIGIEATRRFVRETCEEQGWPLTEIRAKEDCGQDYDEIVVKNGFPGPPVHFRMYQRLKERAVRLLVKRNKTTVRSKVAIFAGIRYDESKTRMGYAGAEVAFVGSQMWVNPLYWWSKADMAAYVKARGLRRNPVSETLGMSGECLCGAFAHAGEKALIRIVCPRTADRLDALEVRVRAAGHDWGWEERPPTAKQKAMKKQMQFMPFCVGCEKIEASL